MHIVYKPVIIHVGRPMPKTYCAFPFKHQYVHMSGSVRLCCATMENATDNKGNRIHMNNDSLQKTWNSDYMKQARLKMKNGEVLEACTKCVEQEARGYKSMRVEENLEGNLKKVNADGSMDTMPHSMELHFGNVCNLKCKMCGQDYSNQIGKEILQIGKKDQDFLAWVYKQSGNVNNWTNNLSVEYTWFQNTKTKNRLIEYVSKNITNLTIIGGEPTVIPEFYELLDFCHTNGTLKNKDITIVTNLTNTNPKMTQWLPAMKAWTIWASLDGIGETTEYIRYPSNFKKVTDNLNFYKEMLLEHGNGSITFSPAIQLLNIHQLDDMLKWFIDFSDGAWGDKFNISWMAQVWYPRICNYDTAPREYRLKVADKLEKSAEYFKKYKEISFFYNKQIENLRIDQLDQETEIDLQKSFIRYNDTQDKHRNGTTWRELLPALEQSLTKSRK
jgi:MoaA/NifB/PqqE/SkfB family radical SAM enzyme